MTEHATYDNDYAPYEQYLQLNVLTRLWPDGPRAADDNVMACGLQAVELLLMLADNALADTRPTVLTGQRLDRFVEVIVSGLPQIVAPYTSMTCYPTVTNLDSGAPPSNADVIVRLPARLRDRLRFAYGEHFGPLPFRTELERYLLPHNRFDERPRIDYAKLVPVQELRTIRRPDPYGPEDVLFASVHQIVECWLRIVHHHLRTAEAQGRSGRWADGARSVGWAAKALAVATASARLLDVMVLRDYHPLRVRLRDGSGAQSVTVHELPHAGRRVCGVLQEELDRRGVSLTGLLVAPEAHPELHRLQADLQDFGRRYQAFLFEHSLLALSVLGVNNFGSLGYPVHVLAQRAAQPIWSEIDQAKFDFTILTNLEHAAHSGAVILRNELRAMGAEPPSPTARPGKCAPESMIAAARRYFSCLETRDTETWLQLFEPDAVLRDSKESRPFIGHRRLRRFIEAMMGNFTSLEVLQLAENVVGDELRVDWTLRAVVLGVSLEYSGREIFSFSDAGRLAEVDIEWEPAEVAKALRRELSLTGTQERVSSTN